MVGLGNGGCLGFWWGVQAPLPSGYIRRATWQYKTSNMRELEQNTKDKKLFDPVKAKAQIEVYKEIYRMEANESLPEHERVQQTDGALRILQTADQNDAEEIAKFFQKKAG